MAAANWRVSLVLATALLLAPGAQPRLRAQEKAEQPNREKLLATIQKVGSTLTQELAKPEARLFDVKVVAELIGPDPDALVELVRDCIENHPYDGALRGSRGVLISGAGNALEKSVLLKDLLEASGFEARLRRGKLPKEKVEALLRRFLAQDPRERLGGSEGVLVKPEQNDAAREELLALAAEAGLPKDRVLRRLAEEDERATAFLERTRTLSRTHRDVLAKALEGAGMSRKISFSDLTARLRRTLAAHTWVEFRKGADEPWTAVDPSFSEAKPGIVFAADPETLEKIPPELLGKLTVELLLERKAKAKLETERLLSVAFDLREIPFAPPTLWVVPAEPTPSQERVLKLSKDEGYALMAGFKTYQAVLVTGSTQIAARPFDLQGRTYRVSPHGNLEKTWKDAAGALGGLGEPAEPAPPELVSVKLLFRLALPGQAERLQGRVIVDGRRPEGEPTRSPIQRIDIFTHPHLLTHEYAAYMPAWMASQNLDILLACVSGKSVMKANPVRFPDLLLTFALLRQEAMARLLGEYRDVGSLWSVPGVMLFKKEHRLDPGKKQIRAITSVDIVWNDAPFIPRSEAGAAAAWQANLALGVYDSVQEGLVQMLGSSHWEQGIGILDRARAAGQTLTAIAPKQRSKAVTGHFLESDRTWIERFTPPEHALLIAGKAPAEAWWSVDLETGSSVVRVRGGGGQANTEHIITVKDVALTVLCLADAWSDEGKSAMAVKTFLCFAGLGTAAGTGQLAKRPPRGIVRVAERILGAKRSAKYMRAARDLSGVLSKLSTAVFFLVTELPIPERQYPPPKGWERREEREGPGWRAP